MSDVRDDQFLINAFGAVEWEVTGEVRPPGTLAARETVRRRRRTRLTLVAAAAALALLVPAGAWAALAGGPGGAKVPIGNSPSAAPTTATSAPTGPPPDGRFTHEQLRDITLDVPAWAPDAYCPRCVSGPVTFADWSHPVGTEDSLDLIEAGYLDVDGDGVQETLVMLECGYDSMSTQQVIVVGRDPAGQPRVLGQVLRQSGAIRGICAARPGSGRAVQVQVTDFSLGTTDDCSTDVPWAIKQWRTYSLSGGAFHQTGGSTSFPVNPKVTDFAVTASTMSLHGKPIDGWFGSMNVTVRNLGRSAMAYTLEIVVPTGIGVNVPAGCAFATGSGINSFTCTMSKISAGGSAQVTIEVSASVDNNGKPGTVTLRVPDGDGDPVRDNNHATFQIAYSS